VDLVGEMGCGICVAREGELWYVELTQIGF
jgi:hypothetical protein